MGWFLLGNMDPYHGWLIFFCGFFFWGFLLGEKEDGPLLGFFFWGDRNFMLKYVMVILKDFPKRVGNVMTLRRLGDEMVTLGRPLGL